MTTYDKYYLTEDLFGEPYPELIEFFNQYEPKGKLLDVGCGQGRDSLSLARLGYQVTGIDNSRVGIDQLNSRSKKEGLNLKGLVGDIYSFTGFQNFDIVLLDSMFHFQKRDLEQEKALIRRVATRIGRGGLICVCIQDTGQKVKILKNTLAKSGVEFEVLNDTSLIYSFKDKETGFTSETNYCMYIVRKN